jgi:hypothetical protein
MIYVIHDRINRVTNFICDSQATIDSCTLTTSTATTRVFTIGTAEDATTVLSKVVDTWVTNEIAEGHLCVNKFVPVEGGVRIVPCNLSTETPNTDVIYEIFHAPTGEWITAGGLDAATTTYNQVEQAYITWVGLNNYITWSNWP